MSPFFFAINNPLKLLRPSGASRSGAREGNRSEPTRHLVENDDRGPRPEEVLRPAGRRGYRAATTTELASGRPKFRDRFGKVVFIEQAMHVYYNELTLASGQKELRMNSLTTYFSGLPRAALLMFALAMVAAVGIIDYLTGYYLGFFLFYLIPVSFAAWFGGLFPAVLISLTSAASWFLADWISNPGEISHVFTIWNTAIRLVAFLIISFALWRIRVYQQKNRDLVEFIVHDLRSPLSTVSLGLGQLKEGGCEELGDREKNILRACRISVTRMFTLVNAILDISKMESKRLEPTRSEGRIGDILHSAAEETSIFAEKKQINLDRRVGVASEMIHTDTGLIMRILVNLISNAVKVSPPGSTVYIAVSDESKDKVRFSVADRGHGIPKKLVGRIFDKFTQIGAAEHGMIVGSGLGLTFCKLAVEALGGRIHIDSKEGEGTTVSFVLPVHSK